MTTESTPREPPLLTYQDAADHLTALGAKGINYRTIKHLVDRSKLKKYTVGRWNHVRRVDIDRLFDLNMLGGDDATT